MRQSVGRMGVTSLAPEARLRFTKREYSSFASVLRPKVRERYADESYAFGRRTAFGTLCPARRNISERVSPLLDGFDAGREDLDVLLADISLRFVLQERDASPHRCSQGEKLRLLIAQIHRGGRKGW